MDQMPDSVIPPPLSGPRLLDEYFIENRTRVLDIAAFLDRLDRAGESAEGDFRLAAFRETLQVLASGSYPRIQAVQMILSDPTTEPLAELDTKSARGAWAGGAGEQH
jgi:hypothetical protein